MRNLHVQHFTHGVSIALDREFYIYNSAICDKHRHIRIAFGDEPLPECLKCQKEEQERKKWAAAWGVPE